MIAQQTKVTVVVAALGALGLVLGAATLVTIVAAEWFERRDRRSL
jgi:hypothetical protein